MNIRKEGRQKVKVKWDWERKVRKTRSSWLNCALRDDDAVYLVSMRRYQLVIYDTGSVEDIHAFIYCTKWRSGQVLPMPD